MKTILLTLTLALPSVALGAPTPAPETPPALSFSLHVSTVNATTGDMVRYRASLMNTGDHTLQIPINTLRHLRVNGAYAAPGKQLPARVPDEVSNAKNSAKTTWRTLRPGESVDVHGPLKDIFPECVGGCQSGLYRLDGELKVPHMDGLGAGQKLPRHQASTVNIKVEPHRLGLSGDGLSLRVSKPMWTGPGALEFQATIRNDTSTATWLPKPSKTLIDCQLRVVTDSETVITRTRVRGTGYQSFREDEGLLLHGGDEVYLTYRCPRLKLREIHSAKKVHVAARIRPAGEFYPLATVDSPYYLDGELRSNEARLK
jgi:hypothetical protein